MKRGLLALLLLALLTPFSAVGQQPGPVYIEDRIAALETRVAALEAAPAPPTATPTPAPTETPVPTVPPSPTATATPAPPTSTPPPAGTPPAGAVVVQPGGDINAAIASAPVGGVVWVLPGVYNQYVAVTKPLSLLAAVEGGAVIIDAQCSRNIGVGVLASDVTIYGFEIRNARISTVRVNGDFVGGATAHRTTVQNNRLLNFNCQNAGDENAAGVSFWYAGSGHRVLGNVINGRPDLSDTAQAKKSGNGVWFKSNTGSPSGGGHLISGNVIRHVYDGIGGETEDDPRGGLDRDSVVEGNTVDDCHDDGISIEGGTRNIEVRDNVIRRCAIGIANAPNLSAGNTVETAVRFLRNDIRESRPGSYGNQLCFKVGNQGTGLAVYEGNTCIQQGDGWGQTNSGVNPIRSRNNVIRVSRYVAEINSVVAGFAAGTDWDGDEFCTSDTTGRFIEWPTGRYASMAAFRVGTGHEANGRQC